MVSFNAVRGPAERERLVLRSRAAPFTDDVKNIDRSDSFISKPKRILALDGGGVKGIISLAFLKRIKAELANRHEEPPVARTKQDGA
mgnify:CR=1 FL=1